ncbi:hypothetical protein [Enterococcus sp. BWB1-3]|uniref:hypothetical protein n=1 Tax=Enterococcus sp. BWB1-3 TaxID=2787713 RepID=UPI0019231469|nr:hypothetical protein [Enterococcus sp. BWB1-3]
MLEIHAISLTTFIKIEALTLNSKLSCDCTSPESISILDSGQGGGGSNGNSILPQLNDAALGMNPLQQYGYLAVGSSGLLIMVKGAGGAIVSAVGWPVLLAGGVIFVFYGLSKINNGVTVMGPPAWAMGSTGVTTIGKVYDQDGNVISSIPGYTDPYGNVTTQNPAKDVGNGITLGPRPEDMAAGGMYTGIYPSVSGHPFGLYEDAPYHTNVGNSVKSKKPIDGQHALDNSVPISSNTDRRVAISNGEIVIIDQTLPGLYHGHVEEWDEVNEKVKGLLRKLGWVNKKGKIIKKED